MSERIKVMIVDDSAVVRQTLTGIIESAGDIDVIATASDPIQAARKLRESVPDVIILDLEMPRMDGLTFLRKLMNQHPVPVIICSSKSEEGSQNAITALEYGAVDILTKPKVGVKQFIMDSRIRFHDAIRAAASSRIKHTSTEKVMVVREKNSADVILSKVRRPMALDTTESIIVVGVSTGGTEALRTFLSALPVDAPGVVIVQHMPEKFTASFAKRLDSLCAIHVKEAEENDSVNRGIALIAPGNRHTLLKRAGARYFVHIVDGPLVSRHRPSVDVLFRSTARYAGKNAIGVIMTGMGDDGVQGMSEMKESGSHTIAQDEASSIVFGMPGNAVKRGVVDEVIPLSGIADRVLKLTGVRN